MHSSTTHRFDGATYDHPRDGQRLNAQLQRVKAVMDDGQWHTIADIARAAEAPEASVSARLRDLRKPRFGSANVERRYVRTGLFEYRLGVLMDGSQIVMAGIASA